MASRVRVFNRSGLFLEQLKVVVTRGLLRNQKGTANFLISYKDSNCRRDVLEIGNFLVVEHQDAGGEEGNHLPPWIGTIETPRDWQFDHLLVTAKTPEHLLEFRYVNGMEFSGSHGTRFGQIMSAANMRDGDLKFEVGELFEGHTSGAPRMYRGTLANGLALLMGSAKGAFYNFTPYFTPEGKLVIQASFYPPVVTPPDLLITDGKNIVEEFGVSLSEDGDIVNYAEVTWDASRSSSRVSVETAYDDESQDQYGLRMGFDTVEQQSWAQPGADTIIDTKRQPRRKYTLAVSGVDGTFGRLRIGALARLVTKKLGFSRYGFGTDTTVRIDGIEYSDTTGRAVLGVTEVV